MKVILELDENELILLRNAVKEEMFRLRTDDGELMPEIEILIGKKYPGRSKNYLALDDICVTLNNYLK
jgi:hypothetical protein